MLFWGQISEKTGGNKLMRFYGKVTDGGKCFYTLKLVLSHEILAELKMSYPNKTSLINQIPCAHLMFVQKL